MSLSSNYATDFGPLLQICPDVQVVSLERSPLDAVRELVGEGYDAVGAKIAQLDSDGVGEAQRQKLFEDVVGAPLSPHPFLRIGLDVAFRTVMARDAMSMLGDGAGAMLDVSVWQAEFEGITAALLEALGFVPESEPVARALETLQVPRSLSKDRLPETILHRDVEEYLIGLAKSFGLNDLATAPLPAASDRPSALPMGSDGALDGVALGAFEARDRLRLFRGLRAVLQRGEEVPVSLSSNYSRSRIDAEAAAAGLRVVDKPRADLTSERVALSLVDRVRVNHSVGPRVSVLIPAYNPKYFEACIRSAMNQTWTDLEILVGDDCPDDQIAKLCAVFAEEDPRIRYIRNPEPRGRVANFCGLFEQARGEFIKYINDDDLIAPSCVERMVSALEASPSAVLVSSLRHQIDAAGAILPPGPANRALTSVDTYAEGRSMIDGILGSEFNGLGEPTTVLFRRDDLSWAQPTMLHIGDYQTDWNGDVVMWTNLLGRGDAIYLAETLSSFRQHDEQVSARSDSALRGYVDWARIRRAALDRGFLLDPAGGNVVARPLRSA